MDFKMNSKISILAFASVLLFSAPGNSEEWTKREWEPVNRSGVEKLSRRRIKGWKSEKSDKSGKKDKKDSKKEKDNFAYSSNNEYPPVAEGLHGEDVAGDFSDIYEKYFLNHFSLGSMSMDQTRPLSTSGKMVALEFMDTNDNARSNPENTEFLSTTSQDIIISLDHYSLTFSLMDSVIPTRRDDYNELVAATELTFKDYMVRSYASNMNDISYLKDFEVEFVKTGISQLDEIFIVFQSTATFDIDTSPFPESSNVQNLLGNGLGRDETLWMEYITALQELNPDNAFSSTINVAYIEGVPSETGTRQSTISKADTIAYSAAACISMLSFAAFIVNRIRDRREFEASYFHEKSGGSRSTDSCQSTIAETLSCASSSVYGEPSQSHFVSEDEETTSSRSGLFAHEPTVTRSFLWDQTLSSFDSAIEDDSINEGLSKSIRAIGSNKWVRFGVGSPGHIHDCTSSRIKNTIVSGNLIDRDDRSNSSNSRWSSLQERQPRTRNRLKSRFTDQRDNNNDTCSKRMFKTGQHLEKGRETCTSGNNQQGRLALIEEKKKMLEQENRHGFLCKVEASQLDEDKREESREKIRAELAIIKAEEASRTAEEQQLKKERRYAEERESSDLRSRLKNYARQAEKLKLEKSKCNFEE